MTAGQASPLLRVLPRQSRYHLPIALGLILTLLLGDMVLVSSIQQRLEEWRPMRQAIEEAAETRLLPVLMTSLVAALGFRPMNQHDTVLNVVRMSCGSCVRHITSALQPMRGVSKVNVQLRSGIGQVQHEEPASLDQLLEAVREAGYEPIMGNPRDG